jgi:uncharacterized membrane protein
MEVLTNWRVIILIYIIITGVWGILVKVTSTYLNSYTMAFFCLSGSWLAVAAFSFLKLNLQNRFGILLALFCGMLGGISSLIFYSVLKKAPANVVIPLSSLYIVVTVTLSYFFLAETITFKKILGIIFGFLAIILLTS